VLLDNVMPRLNGFQVLGRIKADEDLRHVPVIMISGLNDLDAIVCGIELGAEDYLSKPFNRVLLKARVDACLEKKRPARPGRMGTPALRRVAARDPARPDHRPARAGPTTSSRCGTTTSRCCSPTSSASPPTATAARRRRWSTTSGSSS
jgi:DNA-binding response OmpR family regulator